MLHYFLPFLTNRLDYCSLLTKPSQSARQNSLPPPSGSPHSEGKCRTGLILSLRKCHLAITHLPLRRRQQPRILLGQWGHKNGPHSADNSNKKRRESSVMRKEPKEGNDAKYRVHSSHSPRKYMPGLRKTPNPSPFSLGGSVKRWAPNYAILLSSTNMLMKRDRYICILQ